MKEFDCLHEGAVVHAMASVLPAALAAAELRGQVSGAELMVAVAVGVDVAASLGLAARAGFRFFRPATAGGFGAVAAAGRILGLDHKALEAAFAWQLAQVSGTMQAHAEGSPILPVQVAFNARAAMQSCELAALDFQSAEAFCGQLCPFDLQQLAKSCRRSSSARRVDQPRSANDLSGLHKATAGSAAGAASSSTKESVLHSPLGATTDRTVSKRTFCAHPMYLRPSGLGTGIEFLRRENVFIALPKFKVLRRWGCAVRHINATVNAAIAAGEPAISVDTKKKELVGDFKNGGRELRPKGQPEPVRGMISRSRNWARLRPMAF